MFELLSTKVAKSDNERTPLGRNPIKVALNLLFRAPNTFYNEFHA